MRAFVDWAFREHELSKVYATANLRNVRSHRVMEKLGMTREGAMRPHVKVRGERVDEVHYGVLREEWQELTTAQRDC